MKICFVSSEHDRFDKRIIGKEASALLLEGHSVIHVCPDAQNSKYTVDGIDYVTFTRGKGLLSRISRLRQLYNMAKLVDADVYHCNEVDSWFVGVALKVVKKKVVVFDVHEHYPSVFAETRFPPLLRPLVALLVRLVFRVLTPFTDFLVLAKKTVGQDFHCDDDKKVLVRNYAAKSTTQFLNGGKPETSEMTMVHLGLIGRKRGWPVILEAMRLQRNPSLRLKVIGEFNDDSRADFIDTVERNGLVDRVELLPWMPYSEAFAHLASGHIGIVAFQAGIKNHEYAMPHKLFDYMAAGMAALCPYFAVEVAPAIRETGAGCLIDPSSPMKLAKTLDYLVENPKLVAEMGARGKRAVLEKYNWESEASKLIQMYRRIESRL